MSVRAFFAACLFLIGFSIAATAKDLTFTVRPGSVINAFDFGLKTRNFNPYCGADLFWISAAFHSTDDYQSGSSYWSSENIDVEGHAFVLVPHLGVRWSPSMLNRKEDLTSYLKGAYFFSIPSVTATGKRVYQDRYDREVNSYDISGSEEDAASDLLSFGGIELGFGSEFNISDNFALGAEVGLRLIWNNVDYSDSNNGGYSNESWSAELKSAYRFTYTALTLSFNL